MIYEYGIDRVFDRELWAFDNPAPITRICKTRISARPLARYNQLIDDIRNDIVRIEPFFAIARRVVDLDRRREASMEQIADLSPAERVNAQARIGEN